MLRLQLESLRRHTIKAVDPAQADAAHQKYLDWWHTVTLADLFNITNNYMQYYTHNLRSTRALQIWLLEDDPERKAEMASWVKKAVWRYINDHQNAWAAAVMGTMFPGDRKPKMVLRAALQSESFRPFRQWSSPYAGQGHEPKLGDVLMGCEEKWVLPPHLRKPTNYWTWQKRPWDAGSAGPDKRGLGEETGLGFMAPYWLGKWAGALP